LHNYGRYKLADFFFSIPLDEFKRLEDSFYEFHACTASRGCVGQEDDDIYELAYIHSCKIIEATGSHVVNRQKAAIYAILPLRFT
jgi:hypothetical protein